MTEERLRALYDLVAAVREWSNTPMPVEHLEPAERRMVEALAAVDGAGADVALVVELTGEGVRRLDRKPPG